MKTVSAEEAIKWLANQNENFSYDLEELSHDVTGLVNHQVSTGFITDAEMAREMEANRQDYERLAYKLACTEKLLELLRKERIIRC